MISIRILITFINHPIRIGLLLIIQTIITAIFTGMAINTFWISYILLIRILRGILVLFIYISRTASNEKFVNKNSIWIWIIIMLTTRAIFLFLEEKIIIKNNYLRIGIINNDIYSLNKIFNSEYKFITIILVIYLLLTIITSTHLVNIFEGPIRSKI